MAQKPHNNGTPGNLFAAAAPLDSLGRLKPHPSLIKDVIAPPADFPINLPNEPRRVDSNGRYYDHRVHYITDFNTTLLLPKGQFEDGGVKVKLLCLPSQTRILVDIARFQIAGMHVNVYRCPVDDCDWSTAVRYTVKAHVLRKHPEVKDQPYSHPTCSWYPRVPADTWNKNVIQVEETWKPEDEDARLVPDVVMTDNAPVEHEEIPELPKAPKARQKPKPGPTQRKAAAPKKRKSSVHKNKDTQNRAADAQEELDVSEPLNTTSVATTMPDPSHMEVEYDNAPPRTVPWIPTKDRQGTNQDRSQTSRPAAYAQAEEDWMRGGKHSAPVKNLHDGVPFLEGSYPAVDQISMWSAVLPPGSIPSDVNTRMPSSLFQSIYNQAMRQINMENDEEPELDKRHNSTAWIHLQNQSDYDGTGG